MDVEIEVTINAKAEQIFKALTTGPAVWWSSHYLERENAIDLVLEPKVGGRFYEQWSRTSQDLSGALLGTVVAIDPPKLLRMSGNFGITDRAVAGLVSIELTPNAGSTQIRFSHRVVGNLDDQIELKYASCWHDLLGRLKFFMEEGKAEGIRRDPSLDFID